MTATERRMARQAARIVLELRRERDREGAARFEALATETCERMRAGLL